MQDAINEARAISANLAPSERWQTMIQTDEPHPEGKIFSNGKYSATLRRYPDGWPLGGGRWAMIGIWCEDGEPRHDWREFQNIKNDLLGPDWEGVELYPAESRKMDPSNYYMLWCAPKIAIGKFEGRVIADETNCLAPQRPFAR